MPTEQEARTQLVESLHKWIAHTLGGSHEGLHLIQGAIKALNLSPRELRALKQDLTVQGYGMIGVRSERMNAFLERMAEEAREDRETVREFSDGV